jgi:hypothetical protein
MQFGVERGVDVLVMKSPEAERLVVVVQPNGNAGTATVSKRST